MRYPNKCIRCGFCCLNEPCPVAKILMQNTDNPTGKCPYLSYTGALAFCGLVESGLIPVGDGCCIKARAIRKGNVYDFASMSRALKLKAVEQIR